MEAGLFCWSFFKRIQITLFKGQSACNREALAASRTFIFCAIRHLTIAFQNIFYNIWRASLFVITIPSLFDFFDRPHALQSAGRLCKRHQLIFHLSIEQILYTWGPSPCTFLALDITSSFFFPKVFGAVTCPAQRPSPVCAPSFLPPTHKIWFRPTNKNNPCLILIVCKCSGKV